MLLTPGTRPERLAKAAGLDADAVVFDLEDGVPPAHKATARAAVAEALGSLSFGHRERLVRVNAVGTPEFALDMESLPLAHVDAIFLPKVESAGQISELRERLEISESRLGLGREIEIVATIETARGLFRALDIAEASDRITALFFGSGDYAAETGAALTEQGLATPRALVVAAAAAVGAQAIDAAYFTAVKDAEATRRDALTARELGFDGKVVFHPNQIAACNRVFTPTETEVDRARRIVEAHEEAVSRGDGVAYVDGEFLAIDIVKMAERVLAVAARVAERDA